DGGGDRERDFLRSDDVLGAIGAVFVGEHFVCGFPSAVPGGGSGRLSSAFADGEGTAVGVLARHLGPGHSCGAVADFVWWRHRSLDSFVCGGSVSGFHLIAGGDGGALAPNRIGGAGLAQHPGQWNWGAGYGDHGFGGGGREVCRGGLGGGAAVAGGGDVYGAGAESLGKGGGGTGGDGRDGSGAAKFGAADRDCSGGEMECGDREG